MPTPSDPLPLPPGALCIPSWLRALETATSRKLERPGFYMVPTGCDSNGYLTLTDQGAAGLLALGVFTALCQLLGSLRPEHRRACAFLDHAGAPLSLARIAQRARLPLAALVEALPLLASVGWISQPSATEIPGGGISVGLTVPTDPPPGIPDPGGCVVSPPPSGREGKGEEGKGREGRGERARPPAPTPISTPSTPLPPLHPHEARSEHLAWINGLHNNWRGDVLSGPEQQAYLTVRPLLDNLTPDERGALQAYIAHRRQADPVNHWPKRRLQFLENLPDVLTNALDWQAFRSNGRAPAAAGGRSGHTVGLSELDLLPDCSSSTPPTP